MATKTVARTSAAKPASKRIAKAKPAAKKRSERSKPEKVISSGGGANAWSARDKKYAKLFGSVFPKGRVFAPDGSSVTTQAGSKMGLCFAQYAPTADRMSWIYATHGLSQSGKIKLELVLHARGQDETIIRILSNAARFVLENDSALSAGDLLSSSDIGASLPGLGHWIAATPDKAIPDKIEQPGGVAKMVLLLGISDAEMQAALKVNPEHANGKHVLLEALKAGGVFPVTDPKRTCLTRRRDFLRLWESAFRTVREAKAK